MPGALYTADMAARQGSGSENDEFHSLSGQERDDVEEEQTVMEPPIHPVQSMQGAFEESITESTEGSRPRPSVDMTAEERRRKLLDSAQYDDSWTARWKQKKAARYHPCEKLVSQIIFGLHLLQQQQAKSEEEVVKILQTHVNEVDTFLEKTAEDFDLASNDIDERIRFLKLPMAHQDVFETMLDDKKFRTQLLDGNEKIVTIIDRTTKAMNASMLDIHKCIYANRELGKYLDKVQRNWPKGKRGIADVYGAMRGNEHGWTRYLKDLHTKGTTLGKNLVDLANLVGDMSKMAAEASKRSKRIINNGSKSAPSSPGLHSKFTDSPAPPMPTLPHSKSFDKPLPRQPNGQPIPTSNGTTKPHPVPFTDRYEKPRQPPQSPDLKATETPPLPRQDEDPPRPKTAGARFTPRQARAADSRSNTLDLMEFLKADNSKANNSHQNPLRSNPPEIVTPKPMLPKNSGRKLWRSQSQSADILVNPQPPAADPKAVGRSRSQGALDILKAADEAKAQAKAQIRAHTRAQPSSATSHRSSQDQGAGDRPSTDTSQSMRSTGFARRLSKRMKHLPVPSEEPAPAQAQSPPTAPALASSPPTLALEPDKTTPPPDSAYASGSDKRSTKTDAKIRPESILAPLPTKFDEPKYPPRVSSDRSRQQQQEELKRDGGVSVRSMDTSKSRSKSMKSLFQRSWKRGRMMAA